MDIQFLERTANRAEIKISLVESDYAEKVAKEIKDLRKKANVKGFRRGHVPEGIIRKMYGESIEADAIQNTVSEQLYNTLRDEKLSTLGQPVLKESERKEDRSFEATFQVALQPEIADQLGKEDTLTYYKPTVDDEEVSKVLQQTLDDSQQVVDVDTAGERAMLYGTIAELDGDVPKDGGITEEDVILFPEFMKDEEEKKKFDSASVNDIIVFQPFKAFEGDKAELKSLLKLEKAEDAEKLEGVDFSFQIQKIREPRKSEMNQEFFDRAFGEGKVKSEEEALAEIRKVLEDRVQSDANYKYALDLSEYIMEHKVEKIELAEDILRKWIESGDTGVELGANGANPDEHFANIIKSLKHDLYYHALAKSLEVTVTEEDIKGYAIAFTRQQFAQFGWTNAPEEIVEKQAERVMAEDQNFAYTAEKQILLQKVAQAVKEKELITIKEEKISEKDLHELMTPKEENEADEKVAAEAEQATTETDETKQD